MKRFQIYLTEENLETLQKYGEQNNILAATGAKAGQVDKSRVIRMAISNLSYENNSHLCPNCGDDRTGKGSLIADGKSYCNENCYKEAS